MTNSIYCIGNFYYCADLFTIHHFCLHLSFISVWFIKNNLYFILLKICIILSTLVVQYENIQEADVQFPPLAFMYTSDYWFCCVSCVCMEHLNIWTISCSQRTVTIKLSSFCNYINFHFLKPWILRHFTASHTWGLSTIFLFQKVTHPTVSVSK